MCWRKAAWQGRDHGRERARAKAERDTGRCCGLWKPPPGWVIQPKHIENERLSQEQGCSSVEVSSNGTLPWIQREGQEKGHTPCGNSCSRRCQPRSRAQGAHGHHPGPWSSGLRGNFCRESSVSAGALHTCHGPQLPAFWLKRAASLLRCPQLAKHDCFK